MQSIGTIHTPFNRLEDMPIQPKGAAATIGVKDGSALKFETVEAAHKEVAQAVRRQLGYNAQAQVGQADEVVAHGVHGAKVGNRRVARAT